MYRKYFIALCWILCSFSANSINYPFPIFSGEWYVESANYFQGKEKFFESKENACSINEYSYLFKSKDPEHLANIVLNKLSNEENCKWQINYIDEVNFKPETYPTDDWGEAQHTIKSITYNLECLANEKTVILNDYIRVAPIYFCPEGSREGYDEHFRKHCLNRAPLCEADIVGRELASEYKLPKKAGHVGIAGADGNVIEVLNKKTNAITFTPIKEFANTPNGLFWGAKHGFQRIDELSEADSWKIIQAGVTQIAFNPTYTYLPEYVEGVMVPETFFNYFKKHKDRHIAPRQAHFRCDSFVQYSYLKGANIFLWPLVPSLMYNNFKHDRKPLPFPEYIISNNLISFADPEEAGCDNHKCFRDKIKNLIDTNSPIEVVFYGIDEYKIFLNDDEKFNQYLYELYTLNNNKRELSQALLITLALRSQNTSVITKLLDNYNSKHFSKNEDINIVNHFASFFVYENDKKFTKSEIDNISRANEIIIDILKTSYDVDMVTAAANAAEVMMDQEHSDDLTIEALIRLSNSPQLKNRINKNKLLYDIFNNNLGEPIATNLDVDTQNELLLVLKFNTISHFSNKTKQLLLDYLYQIKPATPSKMAYQLQFSKAIRDHALWLSVMGKIGGQKLLKRELSQIDNNSRTKIMRFINH